MFLVDDLQPGSIVVSEIDRAVARSRFTVAVLSPAYVSDRWAMFGEQLASHASILSVENRRIIPLRLTDCELPLHLDALVSLDFTDPNRWEPEAARLRDLVRAPAPAVEQIKCPYPGMRPFRESEFNQFCGRGKERDDLVGRLDRGEREIYVVGPSGSGKSSLVQAGLLHVLNTGSSSRLGRSFVARTMRPGERPTEQLAKALEGAPATPAATVDALITRHPAAERVLVFVDQLEELFTLASEEERQRFIATLRALHAEPRCYLLLALRADFYGELMDSALWSPLASNSRLDIAPLRGAALAQAITEPAMSAGVYLEARLCDRIVADAADGPGVLPLVQETLRLLWDKRRHRYLGLSEYEALGNGERGLDVAIAMHADTTMNRLTMAQQAVAHRVLLRLTSFGEGRADTRRQQEKKALRTAADNDSELSQVLKHLVENRLVTLDGGNEDHDALVDLSHESLITVWPKFRDWIDGRRADEKRRRWLEAKVGDWIERGRGKVSLLDPVVLAEAVQWSESDAARELGEVADLHALVSASRREIDEVKRWRRQRSLGASAVIGVFAALVGILAGRCAPECGAERRSETPGSQSRAHQDARKVTQEPPPTGLLLSNVEPDQEATARCLPQLRRATISWVSIDGKRCLVSCAGAAPPGSPRRRPAPTASSRCQASHGRA